MSLHEQHCDHKNSPQLLSNIEIQNYLTKIPDWKISVLSQENNSSRLARSLKLNNYEQILNFINRIAEIINREDHHPDICFGYNTCTISFTTHSAGGITIFDFICAAQIERIIQQN